MTETTNIVLVGCGKMGTALLQSWLNSDIKATFTVIEPNARSITGAQHFQTIETASKALNAADAIILAIKPQSMSETCAALKSDITQNAFILSIAAGQSIASIESYFNEGQPIIRAMPNTPAAIGKGMSVAVPNAHIDETQKALAHDLLSSAGKTEWIEDETMLDAVTALSGSGPAYVFHLIEVLAQSGCKLGLPENLAMTLARQTVIGAAALAENEEDTPAATLRQNVTSPGGTTEAALKTLMDGRMQALFDEALTAAQNRGKELNA